MFSASVSLAPSPHAPFVVLPPLLLYLSADTAVVLHTHDLALVRVLAFWEAFPSFKNSQQHLSCISVDPGLKLVVVALGSRIAAWSLSTTHHDTWRIHSTLILPSPHLITTLDSKSGLLAVGTENGLAVYNSTLENDLPTWSLKWHVKCPTPSLVSFSPSLMYIATAPKNNNIVRIYSTTSGRQTQAIPHARPVINICWRHSQASSRDDLILYTITADSTLRIFLPVLDSPRTLQLHASLDLSSSIPLSSPSTHPPSSSVFWLDRELIDVTLRCLLKNYSGTDDAQIRVIKDIVEEKWDLFLRVLDDGSIVLNALANIDRRPPTLLQQFTLQYHPSNTLPPTPKTLHVCVLPNKVDTAELILVTSSPLRTYTLSPIEFFGPSLPSPAKPRRSTSSRPSSSKPSSPVSPYNTLKFFEGDAAGLAGMGFPLWHGSSGLELSGKGMNRFKNEDSEVFRFVRTSEGHAVGAIRSGRVGEVWRLPEVDEQAEEGDARGRLVHAGDFEDTDFVVVLDRGYSFATYSSSTLLLTFHARNKVRSVLTVPELESLFTYPTPSSSVADRQYTDESIFGITPDYCVVHIRIEKSSGTLVLDSCIRLPDLPKLPSTLSTRVVSQTNGNGSLSASSSSKPWSLNDDNNKSEAAFLGSGSVTPSNIRTTSVATLNLSTSDNFDNNPSTSRNAVKKIIPVDPMAWGWGWGWDGAERDFGSPILGRTRTRSRSRARNTGRGGWEEHDVLLSISECGELAFWIPEAHCSAAVNKIVNGSRSGIDGNRGCGWRCTGRVRTERIGFNRARCSSAKKTALVVPSPEGDELTIWDSKASEFSSGLEYCGIFDQPILDLDWTSTPDTQSILAVGFARHVELLCQQRMTYFDEGPGWALCLRVDISGFTPYPISDSIWLSHGCFLIGSGNQMTLYGEPRFLRRKWDRRNYREDESLFEYVARQNGPLEDYNPQMVLQCLLWGKVELVKEIIVNLAKAVDVRKENSSEGISAENVWQPLPVERFLEGESGSRASKIGAQRKGYNLLFASDKVYSDGPEDEQGFSRSLVENLIEALETNPLPHLTLNEHAHLLVLIQATLEIDEQRRALDSNGLRYLISMRSFYILNQRATSPTSPPSPRSQHASANGPSNGASPRSTGYRERLRYRDMIWAFHSESQELLIGACTQACNGKMTWADARALGVPVWLNSMESLRSQVEIIARNEYMAGENRDPVACSLFYFALGKVKLVHGLWRQAAWHNEQALMLKFLAHDFTQMRWKTAALKNAFALLGKRRFEYAAAFFLLGGSLKDAVNVCVRQLGDFQLAVVLTRVVEQTNDGPVLLGILKDAVLPIAFRTGNRWLGSWAFWLLHRRDLAVRILLTPLPDIAAAYNIIVDEIGEPHYDDPSLALLFSQLRSKTLQAAQGTSEISGRSEFNFVLQMARVFCRMGCHVLALDLVRTWSFERPSISFHRETKTLSPADTEGSPTNTRRSVFSFEPALRRRSSIMIDMDILSLPPSLSASSFQDDTKDNSGIVKKPAERTPVAPTIPTIKEEGNDLSARKAGLGSLMSSAKQDVQVPEFDMNAFF